MLSLIKESDIVEVETKGVGQKMEGNENLKKWQSAEDKVNSRKDWSVLGSALGYTKIKQYSGTLLTYSASKACSEGVRRAAAAVAAQHLGLCVERGN